MSSPKPIPSPLTFRALLRLAAWPLGGAIVTAVGSAALSIVPLWFIYRIAVELFAAQPDSTEVWRLAGWAVALLLLRWCVMVASFGQSAAVIFFGPRCGQSAADAYG